MRTKAQQARDVAMEQVDEAADALWKADALEAVRLLAICQAEITTDDVWEYINPPREPRAMGPIMNRAQKLGYIEATDRTRQSERERCHARPLRIWRSLTQL